MKNPQSSPASSSFCGVPPENTSLQDVVLVRPQDIMADPERFQYRFAEKKEKNGVGHQQSIQGDWNPLTHGDLLLLYQQQDGQVFVVDGHHRLELAKRLQEQGKGPEMLPARVIKESEGFTAEDAKMLGAYINFAKDYKNPAISRTPMEIAETAEIFSLAKLHPRLEGVLPTLPDHPDLRLARILAEHIEPVMVTNMAPTAQMMPETCVSSANERLLGA